MLGYYQVYSSANQPVGGQQSTTNGQFVLQSGQYARLLTGIKETDWYTVTELGASDYGDDYVFSLTAAGVVDSVTGDVIGQSQPVYVSENPQATVINHFTKKDVAQFIIQKKMSDGSTEDGPFTVKVTNGEGVEYSGDYYVREIGGTTIDSGMKKGPTGNGEMQVNAGQEIVLLGIPAGTTLKVQETGLDTSQYSDPEYSGCVVNGDDPCVATVQKSENGAKPTTVTITNTKKIVIYKAETHLGLHKKLVDSDGNDVTFEKGDFQFKLENVSGQDPFVVSGTDPSGMTLPASQVSNGDLNGHPGLDSVKDFDFGDITFTKPGTYTVKVSEIEGNDPTIGYDTDHVLYVRYTVTQADDGTLAFDPKNDRQIVDSEGNPLTDEALNQATTWTNRKFSASSLPFTGGDATARNIVLAGGGVLLLAGVAWLLARRRRV